MSGSCSPPGLARLAERQRHSSTFAKAASRHPPLPGLGRPHQRRPSRRPAAVPQLRRGHEDHRFPRSPPGPTRPPEADSIPKRAKTVSDTVSGGANLNARFIGKWSRNGVGIRCQARRDDGRPAARWSLPWFDEARVRPHAAAAQPAWDSTCRVEPSAADSRADSSRVHCMRRPSSRRRATTTSAARRTST